MKTITIKAVTSKYGDGVLNFIISGKYIHELACSGLVMGSPVELKISDVNKNKTVLQNNTFHDLLMIYWKSGLPSDLNYADLKIRIKDTYGVRHEIREIAGEQWKVLKSWSKYTLREGRQAIDGLIGEMLQMGCNDKRFQEMIIEWNSYKLVK